MANISELFAIGFEYHRKRQLPEAEEIYRRILAQDPAHPGALLYLAEIAHSVGQSVAAIQLLERGIAAHDRIPELHYGLASILQGSGQAEAASSHYQQAIALKPDYVEALNNLAMLYRSGDRLRDAAELCGRAIAVRPDYAEAHNNLGTILLELGEASAAVAAFEAALRLKADYVEARSNLGMALVVLGHKAPAEACYREALHLRPDYAEAHNNLGNLLRGAGQVDAARHHFERAVALRPDYADAHCNLAMLHMAMGEFEPGWRHFEWRWSLAQLRPERREIAPRWDGSDGMGRTILIWSEQGLGDCLQFCRYVPLLAQRGWKVVLEVQRPLVRLLRQLAGVEIVVAAGTTCGAAIDCQCSVMSLPYQFGTVLETIPARMPYLMPEAAEIERWARRLRQAGLTDEVLKVGLVWAGNPRLYSPALAAVDARRSVPLAQLAPLLSVEGVRFVSLQKDRRPGEVPAEWGLLDLMNEVEDFADTAALVAELDLVIAVDTSVLHLAGAMGKPVWLLNRANGCWRWLEGRDDSPWYPSMRIFHQPRQSDWASVIDHVLTALRMRQSS
ncbi:MAG: tetratricopeptide repeat protein [Aliidongia sp.]